MKDIDMAYHTKTWTVILYRDSEAKHPAATYTDIQATNPVTAIHLVLPPDWCGVGESGQLADVISGNTTYRFGLDFVWTEKGRKERGEWMEPR